MRSKDVLINGFEDIKIFQQYLYMNEDHYIIIETESGIQFKIKMDTQRRFLAQNMSHPNNPWDYCDSIMGINIILSIIEQLKNEPPINFPQYYANRWEEIKTETKLNITFNKVE